MWKSNFKVMETVLGMAVGAEGATLRLCSLPYQARLTPCPSARGAMRTLLARPLRSQEAVCL